jgi:hypothetical protein
LDRRGPKVVYEEVSYNNEMKGGDVEIKELVDRLERNQIPRTSIYPIEEK